MSISFGSKWFLLECEKTHLKLRYNRNKFLNVFRQELSADLY